MVRQTALVLLSLTWSSVAARAENGLSKGRDVVVVVGIAGDLESEKAYADELNGLLDAFALPAAQPKSLTLLVENPAKWNRPLPFPVKVLPDKRESFLTLKGTDPDLVVAWGHGGMQGAKPVLHVPGPRLLPDDFAALAAPGSTRAADYVLYFRGSQDFARATSTAQRRVLASEGEKTFSYDPIGVPLLLGHFGKAADLPDLAAATAKAVGDWYKTRSQAATEQPTLWADAHPGTLPARPETPEIVASNAAFAAFAGTPSSVTGGPESPRAFLGLPVVQAADFPDADAVVLRETVQCVIGDNPQLSQEEERFVQILTSDGKRVGDLNLAFSPPEENLTILDCEIRSPDGHVERVDTGAQAEGSPGEQPEEYPGERRKFFAVPNVVPGATLRLHQRRAWKHFPLPKVSLSLPLAGEFPILEKNLEIRVPAKLPFRFAWKNPPKFSRDAVAEARGSLPYQFHWKKAAGNPTDPAVETGPYGTIYRWQFERVPPLATDPLQAPDHDPELLASTFGDWGEFRTWYQGLIRETDQPTPEMAAKAGELTRGLTTDTDKIRALFRYVTDLRYVAVPLGVNAYRPHAAANVFHHRYGDCKDKANLLNTLLVSQGFDAKLVLAPRFAEALDAVPGAAFNHAISHVNLHGQSLWLDSTDDICRFGLLPPGDPGRNVLLIQDKEQGLRTLPVPAAADSTLTLTSDLALGGDGGQLSGKSEARATGSMDYALRMGARQTGSRRHSSDVLAGLLRPDAGAQTLANQSFTNPGDLGQDFAWSADSVWEGLVSKVGTALRAARSGPEPFSSAAATQVPPTVEGPSTSLRMTEEKVGGTPKAALVNGQDGQAFGVKSGTGSESPPSLALIRAPFQLPAEWTAALQPRTTALFLNMGYPCRIVQRVTLRLPAGSKPPGALPAESRQTDGPLQYTLHWSPNPTGNSVDGELTLTLAKADLSLAETAAFQQTLRALHGALAQGLLVVRSE